METILTYDGERVREGTRSDLDRQQCTWMHIAEPTIEDVTFAATHIGLPIEDLQDLLARSQRPTIRELPTFSVIVFRSPRDGKVFLTKPIVLAVSHDRNDIITLTPHRSKSIERVLQAPDVRRTELFTKGATAVLFAVLDEIVTSYFRVFDVMDEELGRIEDVVREGVGVGPEIMTRVFQLKKTLIYFHKALVGNREVIGAIEREYAASLDRALLARFRILHDQIVQLIELGATYRDILTSTLEVHLSTVSNYLNITVKRVTGWGAIILIPSLIAGIFGMNFDNIPIVHAQFGFYEALVIMAVSTALLYWYFRRKDWI